ncbi:MAG: deoxyribodipyrimidine photo-lyase [Cyanobacteria bacterium P01_A01_bin.37]
MGRTIVWFRRDLRMYDHAPLYRAALRGEVIPVFVFDRALLHHPEISPARVEFMLQCLSSLNHDLQSRGGRLILRYGNPVIELPQLVRDTGANGIYAYIDFERIYGRVRDAHLNQTLAKDNLKIRWFEPPGTTAALMPYPRYRERWYRDMDAAIVSAPEQVVVPESVTSNTIPLLTELGLVSDGKPIPPGGIEPARQLLQEFLTEKTDRYYWQLSYPGAEATSGLSPYIKFGAISVRECYQAAKQWEAPDLKSQRSQAQFIARLRWGSGFAQRFRYLPQLEVRSLYSVFDDDAWDFHEGLYEAWQHGQTGFPIIDAAARCLMETGGWKQLNFRTRAIYSSFLSNLLGIDWRFGALHFMQHLIDGDCPIDHYQWAMQAGVTHCVDKTWTRIYNPEQAAVDRCDPDGIFIKQWIPELAHLTPQELGAPPRHKDYPPPILDYRAARQRRVQQLETQRGRFLNASNIVPYVARMPDDVTPFGSDRHDSEVRWAAQKNLELFPPPIDLDALTPTESKALRTWFVAHVDIKPHPVKSRNASTRKPKPDDGIIQLSILSP